MKRFSRLLIQACFSIAVLSAQGQIPRNPVNVQSPNVASLGLYGEVPISPFTGLPTISIPLYELKSKTITLPIGLSYHASGFRPDQHPGWVGAGWNLSAGGSISRVIKDMPDDYDNGTWGLTNTPGRTSFAQAGYYWNYASINSLVNSNGNMWNTSAGIKNLTRSGLMMTDSEPDEFSFNFLGYSGKFYQDIDGIWKAKCDKPIKIEINAGSTSPTGFLPVPFPANQMANTPGNNGQRHGYSPSFAGFVITAEDGVKYEFGGNTNAIEYNIGFFAQQSEEWMASAWHLTKIIPISGSPITFTYEAGSYISQMYTSVNYFNTRSVTSQGGVVNNCSTTSGYSNSYYYYYSGKLIRPSYLRVIEHLGTSIYFDRGPTTELFYPEIVYQAKHGSCSVQPQDTPALPRGAAQGPEKSYTEAAMAGTDPGTGGGGGSGGCTLGSNCFFFLDEATLGYPCCINPNVRLIWNQLIQIRVLEGGQPIKRVDFRYSNNSAERLTLQSVAEYGSDQTTTKKPYTFSYYPYSYNGTAAQPPYLVNRTDHWGFFNDREAVLPPIPVAPASPSFGSYYAYREPAAASNTAVNLSGMLSSITYPTGGKTDFEYEQHTYAKNLSDDRSNVLTVASDQPAGGLRIKKISSYDNPAAKVVKQYEYSSTNGMSSGILGGMTRYWFPGYTTSSPYSTNSTVTQDIFSSQSVLAACSNSRGSHIGYSRVTEINADGGKKVDEFTNFGPGFLDESGVSIQVTRTPYEPFSENDELRGYLQQQTLVNAAGQTVKTKRLSYTQVARVGRNFVQAVKGRCYDACNPSTAVNPSGPAVLPSTVEEGTAYKLYTYSYLPTQEEEITYDFSGNNPVSITKTHTYNSNKLLASTSTINSKGAKAETLYTYVYERPYLGPPPANRTSPEQVGIISGMAAMEGRNMLAYPVEVINKNNGYITSAQVTNYMLFGNRVLPYKLFTLNTVRPIFPTTYAPASFRSVSGAFPNFIIDPKLTLKSTYTEYDATGNLIGQLAAGDAKTSYQWGYQQLLPTAITQNSSRATASSTEVSLGNEASCLAFETGLVSEGTNINEDYWGMNGTRPGNGIVTTPHTGLYAYSVGPPVAPDPFNYGPGKTFSPQRQQQRYKLSAWVKTSAGFPANGGALVLAANRADGTQLGCSSCYQAAYFNGTQDKWKYVEVILDLDAAHTGAGVPATERFRVAAYCMSANGGSFLIDDLRFQPVESAMISSTYEPNSQQATSISDAKSGATLYEYDPLQRLKVVRDLQGNITSQNQYNYRP